MIKPFTTLSKIRAHNPCGIEPDEDGTARGYLKARLFLGSDYGDDTPITIAQIVESNGFEDALWCLRSMPEWDSLWRHFAVDCAEHVAQPDSHPDTIEAIRVARLYAQGVATDAELEAAWAAAWAAAQAAARAAAWAAAWVAEATGARAAAWVAGATGARAAAWAAAARASTWVAARAAASHEGETAWQTARLLALCEAGEWSEKR